MVMVLLLFIEYLIAKSIAQDLHPIVIKIKDIAAHSSLLFSKFVLGFKLRNAFAKIRLQRSFRNLK